MKLTLIFTFLSLLGLVICSDSKENLIVETWWINSSKVDCTGVAPMSCLQIQKGEIIDSEKWEFFYSSIEGFEYQPGYIYQIKINIEDRPAPVPADASSKIFKLIEVMSKEVDKSLRITNIWKVIEIGEVKNPISFKSKEALIFEFNTSAKTYFGDAGCNSIRGSIKENDGGKLLLGPGASTMMACPDMAVEEAIGKAFIDTRSYSIEDNQLVFKNESGEVLITFQAVD